MCLEEPYKETLFRDLASFYQWFGPVDSILCRLLRHFVPLRTCQPSRFPKGRPRDYGSKLRASKPASQPTNQRTNRPADQPASKPTKSPVMATTRRRFHRKLTRWQGLQLGVEAVNALRPQMDEPVVHETKVCGPPTIGMGKHPMPLPT